MLVADGSSPLACRRNDNDLPNDSTMTTKERRHSVETMKNWPPQPPLDSRTACCYRDSARRRRLRRQEDYRPVRRRRSPIAFLLSRDRAMWGVAAVVDATMTGIYRDSTPASRECAGERTWHRWSAPTSRSCPCDAGGGGDVAAAAAAGGGGDADGGDCSSMRCRTRPIEEESSGMGTESGPSLSTI